jgi:hypothetical protein
VLEDIAKRLNQKYGQKVPLTVHHGLIQDYLGMTINYSEQGKVKFLMPDYINGILDEVPNDMQGMAVTPTAANLFMVRDDIEKLDDKHAETYHHLMAKLLYLCKWAHPDLQTVVSFLMMQVTQPDEYDWKKLAQCI